MYCESVTWDHEHCCIFVKVRRKCAWFCFLSCRPEVWWFIQSGIGCVFTRGTSGPQWMMFLGTCQRSPSAILFARQMCLDWRLLIFLHVQQKASVFGPLPWPWPPLTLTSAEPLPQLSFYLSYYRHIYIYFILRHRLCLSSCPYV